MTKRVHKSFIGFLLSILLSLLLVACSPKLSISAQPTAQPFFVTATLPPTRIPLPTSNVRPVTPTPTTDPSVFAQLFPESNTGNELTRKDEQGMVIMEVTPVNLGMPTDTIVFQVAMNTHSVDLSMNLAPLAKLTTDAGNIVQATFWNAPSGGHHVGGNLIFPATVNGLSVLNGATKITIEIRDVDAGLRTFEWTLH